jgi:iron complex outermembrane receptor protein
MKRRQIVGHCYALAAAVSLLPVAAGHAEETAQSTAAPEEIVVTAERRSEKLQDVPASVTALSGDTLNAAAITSTSDLNMVTPGLRVEATGIYVQPDIRGITTQLSFNSAEANVGTYIDGAYQSSLTMSFYALPDIQDVEVLKGPQGTLYGRNATGGAILINTLKPNLTTYTGNADVSYGNYDDVEAKGFVSAPIVQDKLAASVSAYIHHDGGWEHNLLDDNRISHSEIDDELIRGKIRFDPWDGADFVLTGAYTKTSNWDQIRLSNWHGNNVALALGVPPSEIASQPWQYSQNADSFADVESRFAALNGDIRVGPGTLTTISSFRWERDVIPLDGDNSVLPLEDVTVNSRELTYSQDLYYSTDQLGPFRGTGGLFYYFANDSVWPLNVIVPGLYEDIWERDKAKAYAAYGEGTYNVTDRLSLTAGLRYSYEKKYSNVGLTIDSPVAPDPLPLNGIKGWGDVTAKGSVLYKITDDTNGYFTFSQGFKSGLFNTVSFQATPVNPEKVNSFEGGIKSTVNDSLHLDATGFYYDYTGLQIPAIFQANGVYQQVLENAAKAHIYGSEVDANVKLTKEFKLTLGGTWLHARYVDFTDGAADVPTGFGGNNTVLENLSGKTLIRAPSFSANLTASYTKETSIGAFDANATLFYSSRVYFDSQNRVNQPSYALLNATAGWQPNGSSFRLGIWGKNLTNHAVLDSTVIESTADAVHYAPPRQFGVDARYAF